MTQQIGQKGINKVKKYLSKILYFGKKRAFFAARGKLNIVE